ncbi:MAG: diguanylate cyclase [Bryobacteraceae bacterium]|nr:diguanylate cyclase [Bryobacteraceae bacterium]
MKSLSTGATLYVSVITAFGIVVFGTSFLPWHSADLLRFICFLLITLLGSGLKVALPSATGTLPVNTLFVLIAVIDLSLPEALLLGVASTVAQTLMARRQLIHVVFQASVTALAVKGCHLTYYWPDLEAQGAILRLFLTGCAYFVASTFPTATVIALNETKEYRRIWRDRFLWTFSYYVVGSALAGLYHYLESRLTWQIAMLVMPFAYLLYRSYCLYLGRMEADRLHTEEMSSLHVRTIEALALAIEAKDHTTHDHLQRVQIYAMELGKELGMDERELEALRAASLLHDIGKLAVPEHIISKPGRLTPEEFEKMKVHPVVGAEILERVAFPYPVVPIVRAHHEKWDGTGYPYGISGEEIPLGARILAAVDCLDALATDRQYRKALPLEEAIGVVRRDAGKAFDPRVVEVLDRRYVQLEAMAKAKSASLMKLSTEVKFSNGDAPAAGFEGSNRAPAEAAKPTDFLTSIAAARQEAHGLFEISQDLGNSLSLDETLSLLAVRLKRLVPYDSFAVYVRREEILTPAFVTGENFRLFSSLEIPMGQGLSGWVAENRKPIINGNPSVEPGYLNDPNKFSTLRSALAVPLEGPEGSIGVLALYHADRDSFSKDHLRILLAISSKVGLAIDNALRFRQAESSATTDYLTGLPNARSLFLHLDGELARNRRGGSSLTVLVCDLDGFKAVNDRFGHLEGNKVLKAVAAGLKDGCREYDYVARMGGDEFVLILPGLRDSDIEAKKRRLETLATNAGREITGEEILSFSVGEAQFPRDGADAETLLAEADKRMYRVKQAHKLQAVETKKPSRNFDWRKQPALPRMIDR